MECYKVCLTQSWMVSIIQKDKFSKWEIPRSQEFSWLWNSAWNLLVLQRQHFGLTMSLTVTCELEGKGGKVGGDKLKDKLASTNTDRWICRPIESVKIKRKDENCLSNNSWQVHILTFMAALLSKDQVKFSKLNSNFSYKIFVSCHKLSKTYRGKTGKSTISL